MNDCTAALRPRESTDPAQAMRLELALQEAAHRFGVPSKVHASELTRPGLRMQQVKDLGNALCLTAVKVPMLPPPRLSTYAYRPPGQVWCRYYRGIFYLTTEEKP